MPQRAARPPKENEMRSRQCMIGISDPSRIEVRVMVLVIVEFETCQMRINLA
jgi:hypothetical protein